MYYSFLLKIFSGSIVGYTTNDLALRMLFERVVGIPSVVEQTKDQFIKNISKLVESEIIRHDNIKVELQKPAFKNALVKMFEELIQHSISEQLPDGMLLKDIPGIEASFNNLLGTLSDTIEKPLFHILKDFTKQNVIGEVISPEQADAMARKVYEAMKLTVLTPGLAEDFTEKLWKELSDEKLRTLLSEKLLENLKSNASKIFKELSVELHRNHYPLDSLLRKILHQLEIEGLMGKVADSVAQKRITEILGSEQASSTAKELISIFKTLLADESADSPIKTLIRIVVDVVSQEQTTIFELLPEDSRHNFEQFLKSKLPYLIETVISWIRDNKEEIDEIVNEAFEKNASLVGNWLISLFIESVSDRFRIVEEIVAITRKQQEGIHSKSIAKKGAEEIIKFLKNNSISNLFAGIDREKIVDVLFKSLQQVADDKLLNTENEAFEKFFDQQIGSIWPAKRRVNDLQEVLNYLLDEDLLKEFLKSDKAIDRAEEILVNKINELKEISISKIVSPELLTQNIGNLRYTLEDALIKNRSRGEELLKQMVEERLRSNTWDLYVKDTQLEKIVPELADKIVETVQREFKHVIEYPLQNITDFVAQQENLPYKLTEELAGFTDRNLNKLMEGQVSSLVKENLEKKHKDLPTMVKGFMGKNMKPITYFGAFLGAIAGGLTALLPEGDMTTNTMIAGAVVYGITGLGTNWIAIKMVFRPYREKMLFGIRIPFTPGIMTKNKENFAEQMGKFVGKELLNQQTVGEGMHKKLQAIRPVIAERASKHNFALINRIVLSDRNTITKAMSKQVVQQFYKKRDLLSRQVFNFIENKEKQLIGEQFSDLQDSFAKLTEHPNFYRGLSSFVTERIQQLLHQDALLRDLIPPQLLEYIFTGIDSVLEKQLDKAYQWVEDEKSIEKINKVLLEKMEGYREYTLYDIPLFRDRKTQIKEKLWNLSQDKLQHGELKDMMFEFIDKQLLKFIHPEQKLSETFDGKAFKVLENNIGLLVSHIITSFCQHLSQNKEQYADQVYQTALKRNKLVFLYEGTIRNATTDLLQNSVPLFFEQKAPELHPLLASTLKEIGDTTTVGEIGFDLNKDKLKQTVEEILSNKRILLSLQKVLYNVVDELFRIPVKRLLDLGNLNEKKVYSHLATTLEPEAKVIREHLYEQLYTQHKNKVVLSEISVLVKGIVSDLLLDKKWGSLTEGMTEKEMKQSIRFTVDALLRTNAFKQSKATIVKSLLKTAESKGIDALVDRQLLERDIQNGIRFMLADKNNITTLKREIRTICNYILDGLNNNLTPELKGYVLDKLLNATMAASEQHISTIVNSINFREIVVNEISLMDSKKIEDLFYGFADVYFNRLIIYGFILGWPLGLVIDVGLTMFIQRITS
ncbi:DUF445 family protein [Limibacter armeniacum]|uniref:DUF445 family protein n=1 Tax=Limibacter armeniacum TaxID=466084 RepID=UPI002FE5CB80